MHQPLGEMQGRAVDIAIQAEQIIYLKRLIDRADRLSYRSAD